MPSTYSNLKIQLMATGENTGTWGNVTNDNLGTALEQAIVETATVTFASANVTLTLTNTNARQDARALRLNLTGTTGGARDLIVPAIQKPYLVNNGTADTITVKVSGQTGIAVPAGKSMLLYNNGTDVGLAFNRVVADLIGNGSGITAMNASEITTGSLANARTTASSSNGASTIVARDASGNFTANVITANGSAITGINAANISAGTLAVSRGGTGANTLTSEAVVIGNGTSAVKFVDPGTTGNVLTSNGTAWVSQASGGGSVGYAFNKYTTPAPTTTGSFTWTKPAGLVGVRVIVASGGGGGNGGRAAGGYFGGGGGIAEAYIPAPAIPGPVTVTVGAGGAGGPAPATPGISAAGDGGTSSFGAFISITGGQGGLTTNAQGVGGGDVSFDPAVELFYQGYGTPGGNNATTGATGVAFVLESFRGLPNATWDQTTTQPQWTRIDGTPGAAGPPSFGSTHVAAFTAAVKLVTVGPTPTGQNTPGIPAGSPALSGTIWGGYGAMLGGKWASNGCPVPTSPFSPLGTAARVASPAQPPYGICGGGGGGWAYGGTGPAPSGGPPLAGGNGGPGVVIVEEFY